MVENEKHHRLSERLWWSTLESGLVELVNHLACSLQVAKNIMHAVRRRRALPEAKEPQSVDRVQP